MAPDRRHQPAKPGLRQLVSNDSGERRQRGITAQQWCVRRRKINRLIVQPHSPLGLATVARRRKQSHNHAGAITTSIEMLQTFRAMWIDVFDLGLEK
jgi:hypothetical protein